MGKKRRYHHGAPQLLCTSGKRESFRSISISEPVQGFWDRSVCEVVSVCETGKNQGSQDRNGVRGDQREWQGGESLGWEKSSSGGNGELERGRVKNFHMRRKYRLKSPVAEEVLQPVEDQICKG